MAGNRTRKAIDFVRRLDDPEIATMAAALVSLAAYLVVVFAPWGHKNGLVSLLAVFLLMGFVPLTLVMAGAAVVKKRWLKMMSIIIGLCLISMITLQSMPTQEWLSHSAFQARRERLAGAVHWLTANDVKASRELPQEFRDLSEDGYVVVFEDERGLWYTFSIFTHGIDNSVGFSWSSGDIPPPELAYPQIVSTKRLERGWFRFYST